jgi:hypothetical protein
MENHNHQISAPQNNSNDFLPKLMQSVAKNNPMQLISLSYHLTMADAIQAPTLRKLEKEHGKDNLAGVVSFLIVQTAKFFNIGNNLSEDQALETAYLMLDQYPYETIEDFTLMFREAKKGKYGELYNRLDGQIIFKWMEKYLEEKAIYREKQHQQQKKSNPVQDTDLMQKVIGHSAEEKTVVEALKKAIDYEEFERKEKEFLEFKKNYLKNNYEKG